MYNSISFRIFGQKTLFLIHVIFLLNVISFLLINCFFYKIICVLGWWCEMVKVYIVLNGKTTSRIGRDSLCFNVHTVSGWCRLLDQLLWWWSIWILVLGVVSAIITLFFVNLLYGVVGVSLHVYAIAICGVVRQNRIWSVLLWIISSCASTIMLTFIWTTVIPRIIWCFSSMFLAIYYIFEYL